MKVDGNVEGSSKGCVFCLFARTIFILATGRRRLLQEVQNRARNLEIRTG